MRNINIHLNMAGKKVILLVLFILCIEVAFGVKTGAVIQETLISVDDPTFGDYDPTSGIGVVAKIFPQSENERIGGGKKIFQIMPGVAQHEINADDLDIYGGRSTGQDHFQYFNNAVPVIDTSSHDRIYFKSIVNNTENSDLYHVFISQYACYARNDWWCIMGFNRDKTIYSLQPYKAKESITSYPLKNLPEGLLYMRYQFGSHPIWYDSFDYFSERSTGQCENCIWPFYYKPFVYLEGGPFKIVNLEKGFDPKWALEEVIVPGNTYGADYNLVNTGSNPVNLRVYNRWTSAPSLVFYKFGKQDFTIPGNGEHSIEVSQNLPVGKNYWTLRMQNYLYLLDNAGKALPVYKYDYATMGNENNKFLLFSGGITPKTTVNFDGQPEIVFYSAVGARHSSIYFPNHRSIEPNEFKVSAGLYRKEGTPKSFSAGTQTIDYGFGLGDVGITTDYQYKYIEFDLYLEGGGSAELWLHQYTPRRWSGWGFNRVLSGTYGVGGNTSLPANQKIHIKLDLINDLKLKDNSTITHFKIIRRGGTIYYDNVKLTSVSGAPPKTILQDAQDLNKYWWGRNVDITQSLIQGSVMGTSGDAFKAVNYLLNANYYQINTELEPIVLNLNVFEDDEEVNEMDKWYRAWMNIIRIGDNRLIGGTWFDFKPRPLLTSLDPDTELHLCPEKGINTIFRKNQIFNMLNGPVVVASDVGFTDRTPPPGNLEYPSKLKIDGQGIRPTHIKFKYTGPNPSGSDPEYELKTKYFYYDIGYRIISDEKRFPLIIHENTPANRDALYCIDFVDLNPLDINITETPIMGWENKLVVTIGNWGNQASGSFDVDLYQWPSGRGRQNTDKTSTVSVNGVSPGETVNIEIPFTPQYEKFNLKVQVDPANRVVEHSPSRTVPSGKYKGQWYSELNNHLLRINVKAERYDASTHFLDVNDVDDDNKEAFYMMTNKGNTVSLIETETNSKGNGRLITFPKNADILWGPFDESQVGKETIQKTSDDYLALFEDLLYTLSYWEFNLKVHSQQGGGDVAELDLYGAPQINLSYSYWAVLWANITKLSPGHYKLKSNSTTEYDINLENDAKLFNVTICDAVDYGEGLKAYPEPNNVSVDYPGDSKIYWTFTLKDESLVGRYDDRFTVEDITFDCGSWADCSKALFEPGTKIGPGGMVIFTNFTFIECPEIGRDYEMEMTLTYDDTYHLDCVDNEEKTFNRIVNFNLHERCFCEEFVEETFEGECDIQEEVGCWASDHQKCCGDDEGETWTLQTNKSLDAVLPDGTCFDGSWKILTQEQVAYYDLFE